MRKGLSPKEEAMSKPVKPLEEYSTDQLTEWIKGARTANEVYRRAIERNQQDIRAMSQVLSTRNVEE